MKTIEDIVAAAARLDAEQFTRLRKKLDRLEDRLWKAALGRTTKKMKHANITEEEIDRRVLRRRYESSP